MSHYQLYRRSTLGLCLAEALDELVQAGSISPQLAVKVFLQFDKSVSEILPANTSHKATFKGHLRVYNNVDDVWLFTVKDVSIKFEKETVKADKIKIVACNGRRAE